MIANSGELNDGQHRVWAVLLTNTAVRIPVFYGAQRNTVPLLDNGETRTDAAAFNFAGIKNSAVVAAMIGLRTRIVTGRMPGKAEKLDLYRDDADLYQSCAKIAGGKPRGAAAQAFGVAAMLLHEAGAPCGKVNRFFDEIKSGAGLAKRSATLVLRDAIQSKEFKMPVDHQVYTIIDHYNSWVLGKKKSGQVEEITSLPKVVV